MIYLGIAACLFAIGAGATLAIGMWSRSKDLVRHKNDKGQTVYSYKPK